MNKNKKVIKINIVPAIIAIAIVIFVVGAIFAKQTIDQVSISININKGPVTAESVARIGENGYVSLQDAITDAEDGDTIYILKDAITFDEVMTINKNNLIITVDSSLDGYADIDVQGIVISSDKNITLKNLNIIQTNTADQCITNYGTLNLVSIELLTNNDVGIKNNAILNIKDDKTKVTAKAIPISGKINSMRSNNYAIETIKNANNTYTAQVVSLTNASGVVYNHIIYESLQNVLSNLNDSQEQEEIKLLTDQTLSSIPIIKSSNNIKLNLNKKRLTMWTGVGINENSLKNYGFLSIENGTIVEDTMNGMYNINGTMTISNVTIETGTKTWDNYTRVEISNCGGILNINDNFSCYCIRNKDNTGVVDEDGNEYTTSTNGELNINCESMEGNIENYTILNHNAKMMDGLIRNSGTANIGDSDNEAIINGCIGNHGDAANLTINNAKINNFGTSAKDYVLYRSGTTNLEKGKIGIYNNNGANLTINKCDITSDSYAIHCENNSDGKVIIKKGNIISKNDYGVYYSSDTNSTLVLGEDDKKVDVESLLIKSEGTSKSGVYGFTSSSSNIVYMYDGIIKGTSSSNANISFEDTNKSYYEANYQIIKDSQEKDGDGNSTGYYITRLRDINSPQIQEVETILNESTYNSIRIKVKATDGGDGVSNYSVKYRKSTAGTYQTIENIPWDADSNGIIYKSITGLERNTTYKFIVTIYDEEGNEVTSSEFEGKTTSGIENIVLNYENKSMEIGETLTLTFTTTPSDAPNKHVTWSSSDEGVATVDENGLITAIAHGTATITVTTEDGGKTAGCNVTVTEEEPEPVTLTQFKFTKNLVVPGTTVIRVGGSVNLGMSIQPHSMMNEIKDNIEYESSDTNIATVVKGTEDDYAYCIATGQAEGHVSITARATYNGRQYEDTYGFRVVAENTPNDAVDVILRASKQNVNIDEELQISANAISTFAPTTSPIELNTSNTRWTSSNNSILTVNGNGSTARVTGVASGTATITAYVTQGEREYSNSVDITVNRNPVTSVSLNKSTTKIENGQTETLVATIEPSNATDTQVTWSSNNESVATVSGTGVVTAVSPGIAIITVTTQDGNKTATCTITVGVSVQSVNIYGEHKNKTLKVNETVALENTYLLTPATATVTKVWSSSDSTVASVDNNGNITAKKAGSATITLKVTDYKGVEKSATYNITVENAQEPEPTPTYKSLTGITLNNSRLSLNKGETSTLSVTYNPTDADIEKVEWLSSDESVATVNSGVIATIKAGNATITVKVTDKNGNTKTALCEVTVVDPAEVSKAGLDKITLEKINLEIEKGETTQITIQNPDKVQFKSITYISNNEKVATVDNNGNITSVGVGTTTITIELEDIYGNKRSLKFNLIVKESSSSSGGGSSTSGGSSGGQTSGGSESTTTTKPAKQKDSTTAKTIIPKTGLGKGIAVSVILVTIGGGIMFLKYRRMKNI